MKTKAILLCTVALTLGACGSGPRYTPRVDVPQSGYTQAHHAEDRTDSKTYKQYEHREPCQHYRKLPRNMVDHCARTEEEPEKQVYKQEVLPIVSSYTILFDHDKSNIRANENATLDRAMREISQYNPRQVTVTGYTDSSGKADYNQALSYERAQAVSQALLARGIHNQVLDRKARGQYEQAVQTMDGVRNQENRRVVVDFRR